MNKLIMAHEFMMKKMETETIDNHWELFYSSWHYADAMQAEADKREPSGFPNVLRGACGEIVAVKVDDKEWQPDWSQAPEWANWWAMDESKNTRWIYSELEQPYISDIFLRWCAVGMFDSADAPSFSYTGDWRNSLRKRPQ